MTLKNLKSSLDEKTIILPGHDYSVKRSSTMNEQKLGNPFFHFDSLDKFVEYRMSLHDKIRNTRYDFIKKNSSH